MDTPFLTDVFLNPGSARIQNDSTVIRGSGCEERHSTQLPGGFRLLTIETQDADAFTFRYEGRLSSVQLRSAEALKRFIEQLGALIYIDITALNHHTWASILRASLRRGVETRVVYIEPQFYSQSSPSVHGEIFDLSERISGVSAIPGFASFADDFDEAASFVPLLGFEGRRTAHVLENVQPVGKTIIPIIGLPGFRMEFPFHTYQSHIKVLRETQAWRNVRYAAANNPFSLFESLVAIGTEFPGHMRVAPLGPKPHALGAFLYPLKTSRRVEFVYDFPISRPDQTSGVGKVFVYRISDFMESGA